MQYTGVAAGPCKRRALFPTIAALNCAFAVEPPVAAGKGNGGAAAPSG